jgi:hypothetical protein
MRYMHYQGRGAKYHWLAARTGIEYRIVLTSVAVNFAILALAFIVGLTAKHVIERPRSEHLVKLGLSTTRPAPKTKLPEAPKLGESLLKADGTLWAIEPVARSGSIGMILVRLRRCHGEAGLKLIPGTTRCICLMPSGMLP